MIGLTDREKSLAIAAGGPQAAFSIALAELSMYWDQHPAGRPDVGCGPVINIRVQGGNAAEGVAGVAAVARWLGVEPAFRNGVHIAQRRFGPDGNSIVIEAHYTPDHDAAFAALTRAAEERDEDEAGDGEQEKAA